jgi:hypothetical protein
VDGVIGFPGQAPPPNPMTPSGGILPQIANALSHLLAIKNPLANPAPTPGNPIAANLPKPQTMSAASAPAPTATPSPAATDSADTLKQLETALQKPATPTPTFTPPSEHHVSPWTAIAIAVGSMLLGIPGAGAGFLTGDVQGQEAGNARRYKTAQDKYNSQVTSAEDSNLEADKNEANLEKLYGMQTTDEDRKAQIKANLDIAREKLQASATQFDKKLGWDQTKFGKTQAFNIQKLSETDANRLAVAGVRADTSIAIASAGRALGYARLTLAQKRFDFAKGHGMSSMTPTQLLDFNKQKLATSNAYKVVDSMLSDFNKQKLAISNNPMLVTPAQKQAAADQLSKQYDMSDPSSKINQAIGALQTAGVDPDTIKAIQDGMTAATSPDGSTTATGAAAPGTKPTPNSTIAPTSQVAAPTVTISPAVESYYHRLNPSQRAMYISLHTNDGTLTPGQIAALQAMP